ncbi:hypothetical protein V4F39_23475 [Aquincola sp. MAHUQ-54]|uniref:Uncharacterized protein n=1 Tax=Aquincola agrisoli TaxID=3119538 RepID=A0AAW9QPH5_9BURK
MTPSAGSEAPHPAAQAAAASIPSARIVGAFGYRVDGDTACLNAEIDWAPTAADAGSWSLQLWATPAGGSGAEAGTLVAALPVAVPLHTHGEPLCVEGYVTALPPAGTGPYTMELRLAAARPDGRAVVHDRAAFGQPERFVQPRLHGVTLTRGPDGGLTLLAERVHNPRPPDNLSGTLALELWLLAAPYRGGPFEGRCLASAPLGTLPGQASTGPVSMAVPALAADEARPWCLMLREWTAVGYVTRDHATLAAAAAGAAQTPVAAPSAPADAPAPVLAAGGAAARARPVRPPAPPVPAGLGARLIANLRGFLQR